MFFMGCESASLAMRISGSSALCLKLSCKALKRPQAISLYGPKSQKLISPAVREFDPSKLR